nr:glycine cleavage system aminomethyltransferase GcvT [Calditrichia bacterium]
QYSAMCYPDGGIVDDLLVYRREDHYLLVINASNIDKDVAWMQENLIEGATLENRSDFYSQLAVQGPNADQTLQKLTKVNLAEIPFYQFCEGTLAGVRMIISRTGYTGEPGFELYFDQKESERVWAAVFEAGQPFDIAPIGLGARDSLRLEKKYCLYGNDIDQTTNPYEAGLGWITKLDKGDFIGREVLANIKEAGGPSRRLIAFVVRDRLIPRKDYAVLVGGKEVGKVTSGAFSPILSQNIGLAYVAREHAKVGTEIVISARGREGAAEIVKPPFV